MLGFHSDEDEVTLSETLWFYPNKCRIVCPHGHQILEKSEFFSREQFEDWPHKGSALSLGESTNLKYGVTYPLRTGLENSENDKLPEFVKYLECESEGDKDESGLASSESNNRFKSEPGKIEELYVRHGVCVVSEGPIGGPSKLKVILRPLESYGTGARVKNIVKTKFPQDIREGTNDKVILDTYFCMVEKGGISLYAEGKSESQVSYMAEFQIEEVLSSPFGLIVVPQKQVPNEIIDSNDSKFLYALTHPSKQVSRIWLKSPGNDFREFDASREKILWCERDICVFWDVLNRGFSIKTIKHLNKSDIVHSHTLNASIYYTNVEQSTSPFSPAGGAAMYSPFGRPSFSKNSGGAAKMYRDGLFREGHSLNFWPTFSFDYSNIAAHGHGLGIGFYPPHYCVYDDPEFYFFPMFQFYKTNEFSSEPSKFQVVCNLDRNYKVVAVMFLVDRTLVVYAMDIDHGEKIQSYSVKNIQDFVCSESQCGVYYLAMLTNDNIIKIGFLDRHFKLNLSATLRSSIDRPISSLNNFLYEDTLICSLQDSVEKLVFTFKNWNAFCLTSVCIKKMSKVIPSATLVFIMAFYVMGITLDETSEQEWDRFIGIVLHTLQMPSKNWCQLVSVILVKLLEELGEDLKTGGCSAEDVDKVQQLAAKIRSKCPEFPVPVPIFEKILNKLSIHENDKTIARYIDLPVVIRTILGDKQNGIFSLSNWKLNGNSFSPVVELLIADLLQQKQQKVMFDWPQSAIEVLGRDDYLIPSSPETSPAVRYNPFNDKDDLTDDNNDWSSFVLSLQIFTDDRRLEEVCKLLDSASPLIIDIEQKAEMSDHDFLEDQEKHLLQMMQVTLSSPVGRAAFTLRSEVKSFTNLTNVISIPRLCLSGKCSKKGTNIELNDSDLSTSLWPLFHNAVAATVAVRFSDQPADAWFAYNKAKTPEGAEQAGMILGFGLNGVLLSMPATLHHEYLSKENSYMSMAMLLGLSVNKAGTGDIATWKVISLHIGAMLPACTTELEIPKMASLVAPCALGILFMGTHHNHIAKVLLGEISKRYSPLSLFGGGSTNNAATTTTTADPNGSITDREAHSLCAGFGLGFVNLGKGRIKNGNMDEDGFDGILRRFVVGGPKPHTRTHEDEDLNQFGPPLPSLWEEYRCCHIEEGDNVNVDVATPSAIVAVALTYLKSGNDAVLKWLSPPTTLHLLDCVRPDILMLRSIAYILVLEEIPETSVHWLENNLIPRTLIQNALTQPREFSRIDHESINQAWASIVCGYCLGLGIRFAGTSFSDVEETVWHYINLMLKIAFPESNINAYFPKNFLESTLCSMLISLSLVMAGTGNVATLSLCRYMQHKVSIMQVTSANNSYGLEMCTSMATGILFLGGGRYSLCNDDKSIAVILASVFPKWPINGNDNRYHLQALRHLYILACQPRLLLPQPMPHGQPLSFEIEFVAGQRATFKAPLLLPPFDLIARITLIDKEYLPVEFILPRDLEYLKKVVKSNGIINVVQKPISSVKYNFLKQMAWRESRVFHSTFPDESEVDIPIEENQEVKELNMLSRLAEAAGLRQVVPALVSFKNSDITREDWQHQLRILYWWTSLRSDGVKSSIPTELLGIFLNKTSADFKLFNSKND